MATKQRSEPREVPPNELAKLAGFPKEEIHRKTRKLWKTCVVPTNKEFIPTDKKGLVMEEVLDWLRTSDTNPDKIDEPSTRSLAPLAEVPMPRSIIPST